MKKNAQYIVRFDDIYPTMNWEIWKKIEEILDKKNILPILAVIPDNKDNTLFVGDNREDFWEEVKRWKKKGYIIAVHGLTHVYENSCSGMLGITSGSEFAQLSYERQDSKLKESKKIFSDNDIPSEVWIAPSHSFDKITLKCLKENGFRVISDGFMKRAVFYKGLVWLPSQLWDKFTEKKSGIWTVCYHPNTWQVEQLMQFEKDVNAYCDKIVSVQDILEQEIPRCSMFDWFRHHAICCIFRIKKWIKKYVRR